MIPRYGKLNKIYTGIMSGDSFSFEKQQFISDFYREYGDTQPFETALISLMLEMDAAHFSILLNSLKREIESNISTSWMNCTGRRSRQDGKPCNACKTVAGTFAGWAAHYWQSLKNT